MIADRVDRQSCVLALGGEWSVIWLDLRPQPFYGAYPTCMPTTLPAQVDSGSVENRSEPSGRRNLIGAFYQPRLVVIDVSVIQSLPRREFVAGLAEVIKYGIIDDPALFRLLEEKT